MKRPSLLLIKNRVTFSIVCVLTTGTIFIFFFSNQNDSFILAVLSTDLVRILSLNKMRRHDYVCGSNVRGCMCRSFLLERRSGYKNFSQFICCMRLTVVLYTLKPSCFIAGILSSKSTRQSKTSKK